MKIINDSKSPAKAHITVQPGDELDVPDDVAAQLQATDSAFKPSTPHLRSSARAVADDLTAVAAVPDQPVEPEPTIPPEPLPKKASAKKKASG